MTVEPSQASIVKKLICFAAVLVFGVWLGAWGVVWFMPRADHVELLTTQPLADIFNSLNALFTGLAFGGVIITSYIQIQEMKSTQEELKKTAEANKKSAEAISATAQANNAMAEASKKMEVHSDERAVLDLFQVYCSDYFQGVKDSSMSVLIPCVASKDYFDFVVSRFFVAEQLHFPEQCWEKISKAKASFCKTYEEFVVQEQRYRYKLDELINFFTVLTGRKNAKEIIQRCDFSYSWWRPLFWMIASQQKNRYASNEAVRTYATPLYFPDVVLALDEIYGYAPFSSERDMWEFVFNHPKVKSYGLDPEHKKLLEQL